ncbi:MAG: ion transporter [Bacteroidetes bacterium]|nr:MAG: ion transporter [Bacteroidota bacterium]
MRKKLRKIIFGVGTPAGRKFDIILLYAILLSVTVVMLESVKHIRVKYESILYGIEWVFTILFSIEYIARVYSAKNRWKYIFSFYGIIDLISTIPSYIGLFVVGTKPFIFLRAFRLLRVFRIFNLPQYIKGSKSLIAGLKASKGKIVVFMIVVLTMVMIIGGLMYIIEGEHNGFTSIPRSIYWAIVTITTVGYGDISPKTEFGQLLASFLMLVGYAIIAVPSGIVTASVLTLKDKGEKKSRFICPRCQTSIKQKDANYCHKCGEILND